ncbi:MAG: XdhC family protein, partial [Planctomycetes bacterium]|nr:XdhC family protein [Planctomycetota bacterium]
MQAHRPGADGKPPSRAGRRRSAKPRQPPGVQAALARGETPIGVDVGSRTSEEIAVSIVARLIQVK